MTLEKPSPQIQALSLVLWFQNEGGWIPQKEAQNLPEPPRPPGQDERTSPGRHRDNAVPAAGFFNPRTWRGSSRSTGRWSKRARAAGSGGFGGPKAIPSNQQVGVLTSAGLGPKSHTGPGTLGLLRSFQIENTPVRERSGNGAFQACSPAAHGAGTSNDHMRRPNFAVSYLDLKKPNYQHPATRSFVEAWVWRPFLGRSQLVTCITS